MTSKKKLPISDQEGSMKFDLEDFDHAQQEVLNSRQFLFTVIENCGNLIYVRDAGGNFVYGNQAAANFYGTSIDRMIGRNDLSFGVDPDEARKTIENEIKALHSLDATIIPQQLKRNYAGESSSFQTILRPICASHGQNRYLVCILTPLTVMQRVESPSDSSKKMEAIGLLASGIAHEINTPSQYVSDNLRFVKESFEKLEPIVTWAEESLRSDGNGNSAGSIPDDVRQRFSETDVAFLKAEIPQAVDQSLDGISLISSIIRSMKDIAHPGTGKKELVDINRAIESAVCISRHEWKYVADVETDLKEDLPQVPCYSGEIDQVVLNLVINAAHAISEVRNDRDFAPGKIRVSTSQPDKDWIEIQVCDTGSGIPEQFQNRIFERFFTTKKPGQGSGQGLPISRSIVVERHSGQIGFETEPGKGTTFTVRLPIDDIVS